MQKKNARGKPSGPFDVNLPGDYDYKPWIPLVLKVMMRDNKVACYFYYTWMMCEWLGFH